MDAGKGANKQEKTGSSAISTKKMGIQREIDNKNMMITMKRIIQILEMIMMIEKIMAILMKMINTYVEYGENRDNE